MFAKIDDIPNVKVHHFSYGADNVLMEKNSVEII